MGPLISDEPQELFPLLRPIRARGPSSSGRFSVTQLVNYRRCPRQYFFDRILRAPDSDEVSVWSDSEVPEPPANLTATLRGSVIHRFCERYDSSLDVETLLGDCFDEVMIRRRRELAERLAEIDREKALHELRRLADNYISSKARARVDSLRQSFAANWLGPNSSEQLHGTGVYSERKFRLRLPYGVLFGTIDKLLVSRDSGDGALEVEILDFKTNRFRASGEELKRQIEQAASEYTLQIQAYCLAVRKLMPGPLRTSATLHFLDPNVEFRLNESILETGTCEAAINEAMQGVSLSSRAEDFQARPEKHCRSCNFLGTCREGREWLRSSSALSGEG
ncbi:MAG: RecB family exonuclease, partial [Blastocatellia bacterium]